MESELEALHAEGTPAYGVYAFGIAKLPDLDHLRTGGTAAEPVKTLIVRCGCKPQPENNQYYRLGDGRCIRCPDCGAIIARVGHKVVAANW